MFKLSVHQSGKWISAFHRAKLGRVTTHSLVEMLLDAWLIRQDAGSVERYTANFDQDTVSLAARLGSATAETRGELERALRGFATSRFLED